MRRLIDHNPMTGVTQYHHYDTLSKETTIETVQYVSEILNANHELRKDRDYSKRGIKNDWWHAASIPIIVQYKWLKDFGIDVFNKDHAVRVNKLLDSPDWRYLKTTEGKIGKRIKFA